MHLTENQIALDAMECVFRPGVQTFYHPFIVTISPERLASSIELAPLAYRDAFALAWDKGFGDSRISDMDAEARNLSMAADDAERRCTLARQNLVEEIAARQNAEGEVARLRRAFLEYQQAPVVGGVSECSKALEDFLPYTADCNETDVASYRIGFRIGWNAIASRLHDLKPGEVVVNQSHLGTLYERIAWISCQLQVGYSAQIAASELADLLDAPCFADRRAQPTPTEKEST